MGQARPLASLLRIAANRLDRQLSHVLAPHGVTASEWSILHALYKVGAVPPSILAERVGVTRGAVTRLVDRLRAKALVVRASGGGDARMQTIALTGAGARLTAGLMPLIDRHEASVFASISTKTRGQLAQTLQALAARDSSG